MGHVNLQARNILREVVPFLISSHINFSPAYMQLIWSAKCPDQGHN